MGVFPDTEKDDFQRKNPTYTYTGDDTMQDTTDHQNNNQLTITTILSMDLESGIFCEKAGVNKVESLSNAKSTEYIISEKDTSSTSTDEFNMVKKENWYAVTIQIFIPFMIAGCGTIGAGLVLGNVENYEVFQNTKSLYILVPSLLGLKGNLDMCLASRLSTQANLGNMKSKKELFKMIMGNLGLVQIQAIVASTLVALFAVVASGVTNGGEFEWQDSLLLSTSSVLTSTLSCFILDIVLITLIILSKKFHLNPDNIATPFAASIGDVISLMVLSLFAQSLYRIHDTYPWLLASILVLYLCILLPVWVFFVSRNEYTKKILFSGWTPVLSALVISGCSGLLLNTAVDKYDGYEVFQPIVNGIGGNLVSIHASRISTMLHQTTLMGVIPSHTKTWVAPWKALFRGVLPSKTARILIAMSIPGQSIFVFVADIIYNDGTSTVTPVFFSSYLLVSTVQVMLLLYIAHIMIHIMWKFKVDPDSCAIPYLTALGDLLGSSLLLLAFIALQAVHMEYQPVKSHVE